MTKKKQLPAEAPEHALERVDFDWRGLFDGPTSYSEFSTRKPYSAFITEELNNILRHFHENIEPGIMKATRSIAGEFTSANSRGQLGLPERIRQRYDAFGRAKELMRLIQEKNGRAFSYEAVEPKEGENNNGIIYMSHNSHLLLKSFIEEKKASFSISHGSPSNAPGQQGFGRS